MIIPNILDYNLGDTFIVSADVGDLTPYDIQWCDIKLYSTTNYGKPIWSFEFTQDFFDFMYEHFWYFGISWDKFDEMVKKKIGIRCWSENIIKRNDEEKYKALCERRLEIHHQKVLSFQDFELTERQKTRDNIKLAEIMYKMRLGVLARLDKRYRNFMEVEANMSDSLAKIIIARKQKESEE